MTKSIAMVCLAYAVMNVHAATERFENGVAVKALDSGGQELISCDSGHVLLDGDRVKFDSARLAAFEDAWFNALAAISEYFLSERFSDALTNNMGVVVNRFATRANGKVTSSSVIDIFENYSADSKSLEFGVKIQALIGERRISKQAISEWLDAQDPALLLGGRVFTDKDGASWLVGAASAESMSTSVLRQKAVDYALLSHSVFVSVSHSLREKDNPKRKKTTTRMHDSVWMRSLMVDESKIPQSEEECWNWTTRTCRSVSTGRKLNVVVFAIREKDVQKLIRCCYGGSR